MPQGDYGDGLRSPGLHGANDRLNAWSSQSGPGSSPGIGHGGSGIVLDDARKFRRSARIPPGANGGMGGAGGFGGGALGGMYDENQARGSQSLADSQRRAQLSSMQQNAINLGLGGASVPSNGSSQRNPNGSLNSPGLQQTAMAAQQNWRNGLNSPSGLGNMAHERDQYATGMNHHGSSAAGAINASAINANAQLANLVALQQQVLQQQQQLNNSMAAAGVSRETAIMQGSALTLLPSLQVSTCHPFSYSAFSNSRPC